MISTVWTNTAQQRTTPQVQFGDIHSKCSEYDVIGLIHVAVPQNSEADALPHPRTVFVKETPSKLNSWTKLQQTNKLKAIWNGTSHA